MRVAFYSNVGGKNAVTTNLACISVLCAIEHRLKTVIIENHSNLNNIENALVRYHQHSFVNEQDYYFSHVGMEHLMKRLHSSLYNENIIESAAMKFLNNHIYYIPQGHNLKQNVYEYQLNEVIKPMLSKMEDSFDLTFIDTKGQDNLTTKVILTEADLVVVNLSQNHIILNHFFENYKSLIPKSIFFISRYDSKSKYSLKNIMRKYHIPKEKIVAIPYNVELKDSISEGGLIDFIARNYQCEEGDSNYNFMQCLKLATSMIIQKKTSRIKEGEGVTNIS